MQKAGHHVTSFGIVKLRQSSPSGDTGQKLAERFLKLVLISFPRHTSSLSPTEKNGRSVTKRKKFGLLRMGYTLHRLAWRGTNWPKLLFPSLPHLLHRPSAAPRVFGSSKHLIARHNICVASLLTNSCHLR